MDYILAHDLGTSGDKAVLYDFNGRLCTSAVHEYPTYTPAQNFVEQEPEDWWKAVCVSTLELLEKTGIDPDRIACVTFSGQMMGCLPVGRDGAPLRRSIIWADTRSEKQAQTMQNDIGMERCYRLTGHRISSSYTAAKLLWLRDNEMDTYRKAYKILQAKDFIVWKLTGVFATDYSDASGTNLFNIEKKCWERDLLTAFSIDENLLPELHASTDVVGAVTPSASIQTGLRAGTPVVIGGGDGSCAAVGAGIVEEGRTYNAIGTSSWIACAAKKPYYDPKMRTFNWVHLDRKYYTPCGTMQAAGYSLSWLKNNLCGEEQLAAKEQGVGAYELIDKLVLTSPVGAHGLLFLPYLLGERSPRWNANARGAFIGLKAATTKADICRAVLEGVGFNLKGILDIISEAATVDSVTVIGGGATSDTWMQIFSDIWQKPLLRPRHLEEATSMGAAVCGGVGIGAFDSFKAVEKFGSDNRMIFPNRKNAERYNRLFDAFNRSYEALKPVFDMI